MNVFCSLVQSGAEAKNDTGAKERINKVAAEGGALLLKGNGSEGGLMAPFLILDQKNRLIVTTTVMIDVHGTVREALKAITDAANSQRRPLRRDGENLQALRVVRSPRRWAQDWARQQRRDDNGEEKHGEDDAPRGVDIFTMDRRLPHADTCALLSIGGVGSGAHFHQHADAWNCVVYGRKRSVRTRPGRPSPALDERAPPPSTACPAIVPSAC